MIKPCLSVSDCLKLSSIRLSFSDTSCNSADTHRNTVKKHVFLSELKSCSVSLPSLSRSNSSSLFWNALASDLSFSLTYETCWQNFSFWLASSFESSAHLLRLQQKDDEELMWSASCFNFWSIPILMNHTSVSASPLGQPCLSGALGPVGIFELKSPAPPVSPPPCWCRKHSWFLAPSPPEIIN